MHYRPRLCNFLDFLHRLKAVDIGVLSVREMAQAMYGHYQ